MIASVERIREATRDTKYEGRLYLVGGVVRDEVMGCPPTEDVDIVLEGDALELAKFLHEKGIAEHRPVTYTRFGTAMIIVSDHTVELVSARKESYLPHSRKPEVEHAGLREDVLRRDFTINTLLKNLHSGEILDLTGKGLDDIRTKIIRTPTNPEVTFHDDPLRMLRAIRFAVRLEFEIEKETYLAITQKAERLKIVSKERIRDELTKILLSAKPARGFRMLEESNLLSLIAPELSAMKNIPQIGMHAYNVWEHTLHSLEFLPESANLVVRMAVLYHDVGKVHTWVKEQNGSIHFYGHEEVGAKIARKALTQLRFPTDVAERVKRLILMHMRIAEYRSEWKDSAVRRLMRDAGPDISDLLMLAKADRAGTRPNASMKELDELRERMESLLVQSPVETLKSPLDGKEIMEILGLRPGAKVGKIKNFLEEEVIEGRLNPGDKHTARKLIIERFGGK